MTTAVVSSVLSFIAGICFYRNADKLLLQPFVMGKPIMVGNNPIALPSMQGELAVSPSPDDVFTGELVPVKTHQTVQ